MGLKPVNCGCGGEAVANDYIDRYENKTEYFVHCVKCGICSADYNTESEAVTAWNRAMSGSAEKSSVVERTAKVEEDEWTEHKMLARDYGKIYYQHDCCCDLYESPYQFCPYCGKKMKRGDR